MHYCTRVMLTDYSTDDTCATVHVRHATTDRSTRALPTRGHACPSVHLADCRITNLCGRRSLLYSTCARGLYTWAHPPTCAPYTAVWLITSVRAPVVKLQAPFLGFRDVLVATSRWTARRRSGRFPQLRAMGGQKALRADTHASWLVHELVVEWEIAAGEGTS